MILCVCVAMVQLVMDYKNWLAYFFRKQKKVKKEKREGEENEAKGRTYDDLLVDCYRRLFVIRVEQLREFFYLYTLR